MRQITDDLGSLLHVLLNDHRSRLREELVDLLERLVLGLRHEDDLVEPAQHGNTTVETEGQTDTAHGVHHAGEVVGDDEGAEEEVGISGGHTVVTQVGGEDLRRNDPGQAGVGTKEAHVQDDTGEVDTLSSGGVLVVVDGVTHTDENKTNEEAGKHGISPVTTAEALHVHDGRDGADQQRTTTDEGHEDRGLCVEADGLHEG